MRVKSRLWVLKIEGLRDRRRNERGREGGRKWMYALCRVNARGGRWMYALIRDHGKKMDVDVHEGGHGYMYALSGVK